jgi:hypothetical protein
MKGAEPSARECLGVNGFVGFGWVVPMFPVSLESLQ